ncbi:hypothetical protein HYH03_002073 [Edaphochlamys debaryana]|uniref:Uncharacterized protein n=1 Tax=Edaphochlamys debaryana TaxID=47281 RepID=A0A835YF66_9CHLO|nr:hypothetical protein HYH03_002073 [Edaphochlamys debaryana]|eukprot:KAG2499776.1 hypothetical protein HYH03_002073 [Edaphochlamys debaryana]
MLELSQRLGNAVVYLETGAGKTRIAAERILAALPQLSARGQLAAFLAPTVPLVKQQAAALAGCGLRAAVYTGEDRAERRSRGRWQRLAAEAEVLVATPAAFVGLLAAAYLRVPQFGILVLDEAHHTRGDHPYALLVRVLLRRLTPPPQRPQLLGLTASPHAPGQLQALLGAPIITARDSLAASVASPTTSVHDLDWTPPAAPPAGGTSLLSNSSSCGAAGASPGAARLDAAAAAVQAAALWCRSRDMAFRRSLFLPSAADADDDEEAGLAATDEGEYGTAKQLEHLRSQLAATAAALRELGPWPAAALAAADLFGPSISGLPLLAERLGGSRSSDDAEGCASGGQGGAEGAEEGEEGAAAAEAAGASLDVWIDGEGDFPSLPAYLLGALQSESSLGTAEEADPRRVAMQRRRAELDLAGLVAGLPAGAAARLGVTRASGDARAPGLGLGLGISYGDGGKNDGGGRDEEMEGGRRAPLEARVVVAALAAAFVGLAEALGGHAPRHPRDAALQGFLSELATASAAPFEARDASRLAPWAEALLASVGPEELSGQVFAGLPASSVEPATPAAAGRAGGALVTPAVQWLLAAVAESRMRTAGKAPEATMVFCQRKTTVLALQRLIEALPLPLPPPPPSSAPKITLAAAHDAPPLARSLPFLGNSSGELASAALAMGARAQEAARLAFSTGSADLLVCTDVAAEGLDFAAARLVVMFDPPAHLTPYQAELLAKHAKAEEAMVRDVLRQAATVEAGWGPGELLSDASGGEEEGGEGSGNDLFVVPESGAVAFGPVAQGMLESYCWQLPGSSSDGLLQPYLSFQAGGVPGGAARQQPLFRCTVHLPSNAPVTAVEGPWEGTKNAAKQKACVAALRQLYDAGALAPSLEPRFTRRGCMRDAETQGSLLHGPLPAVTFTHRLPRTLQPPAPPPAAVAAPGPLGAGGSSAATDPTAPHCIVRHLYGFLHTAPNELTESSPLTTTTEPGTGATATAAEGLHDWGVLLHRALPCDLPAFPFPLASGPPAPTADAAPRTGPPAEAAGRREASGHIGALQQRGRAGATTCGERPVAAEARGLVRVVYLGPMALGPAEAQAVAEADRALCEMLLLRARDGDGERGEAAAQAAAVPERGEGLGYLEAWSKRLGLTGLRAALEALQGPAGPAGTPPVASSSDSGGELGAGWWSLVPLAQGPASQLFAARTPSSSDRAASSPISAIAARSAASPLAWPVLEALAEGPVPLQRLLPQELPPLRRGPVAADGSARSGTPPDAQGQLSSSADIATADPGAPSRGALTPGGPADPGAPGAGVQGGGQGACWWQEGGLGARLRSHGLLLSQAGAQLLAFRRLKPHLGPDSPMPGAGGETYGGRLSSRWGVDPACLRPDQPLIAASLSTSAVASARVGIRLNADAADAGSDDEHAGDSAVGGPADAGPAEAGPGEVLLLPQALALAPLTLGRWRSLRRTPALLHRLEGLAGAAEALEEVLRPAGLAAPPSDHAVVVVATAAALASRSAGDPDFDCERLEFLGDAVLRYHATLYVYGKERHVPASHEGVMSYKRDELVANATLRNRGLEAGLQHWVRALPYDLRRTLSMRLPEGAALDDAEADKGWREAQPASAPSSGGPAASGLCEPGGDGWCGPSRATVARGKRLADCVEALVGAQLLPPAWPPAPAPTPTLEPGSTQSDPRQISVQELAALVGQGACGAAATATAAAAGDGGGGGGAGGGLSASLRYCVGLGLLPPDAPSIVAQVLTTDTSAPGADDDGDDDVHRRQDGSDSRQSRRRRSEAAALAAAEAALGYRFRRPALAVRALTHVSWPSRRRCADYQLLEFVGDAALGLVASLWVYRAGGSPGRMSLLREALVRNDTLAAAAAAAGLHGALRARQRELAAVVERYAAAAAAAEAAGAAAPPRAREGCAGGAGAVLLSPDAPAAAVAAPKVLADVVEALTGAVLLDSGGNLAAAEQAIHRLLERVFASPPVSAFPADEARTSTDDAVACAQAGLNSASSIPSSGAPVPPGSRAHVRVDALEQGLSTCDQPTSRPGGAAPWPVVRAGLWRAGGRGQWQGPRRRGFGVGCNARSGARSGSRAGPGLKRLPWVG